MNYEMYEYQGDWYYKVPAISKYAGLACAYECEFPNKRSGCTNAIEDLKEGFKELFNEDMPEDI